MGGSGSEPTGASPLNVSRLLTTDIPSQRVLYLDGSGQSQASSLGSSTPLGWIPLGGFRVLEWKAPFPRRVEATLRAAEEAGGLGMNDAQVQIVKTCLRSLATSRE